MTFPFLSALPRCRVFVYAWVVGCLVLGFHGAATAQTPAYTIVDLGLSNYLVGPTVNSINNAGQVAGTVNSTVNHYPYPQGYFNAVRWTVTSSGPVLDVLRAYDSYNVGRTINDAGLVAGADNGSGYAVTIQGTATLWPGGGTAVTLGSLAGTGGVSYPFGSNNGGQFVGYSNLPTGSGRHAALWTVNGSAVTLTDLGTLGGSDTSANGINSLGQIVGYSQDASGTYKTVLWTVNGSTVSSLKTIPSLAGSAFSFPNKINDAGQIAGNSNLGSNTIHATLWVPDGSTYVVSDLGTLGGTHSDGTAINRSGQITGTSTTTDGSTHGFLYLPSTGMLDVNNLVGASPLATNIQSAFVNDFGQIAGVGLVGGVPKALLLNPTTPSTTVSNGVLTARFAGGTNYQATPSFADPAGGNIPNVLTLLGGTAGNGGTTASTGFNREVSAQFVTNPNAAPIVGNAVTLTGTGSDLVVVQIAYDKGVAATLFAPESNTRLGWYNGTRWLNAVDGNTGNVAGFAGTRAYNAATDFRLGTHGVDLAAHMVWAVVNHGGTFGVTLDPEALKKLKSVVHTSTTTTLAMDSFVGHTYQFQRASTLVDDTSFTNVGNPQTGSTGTVLTFTSSDGAATQGFYRVRTTP